MLKFKPEPLEVLRARLPKALARRFDVNATVSPKGPRPGELREHVFDTEDHIRCLISMDYQGGQPEVYLHISCSSTWDTKLEMEQFMKRAEQIHTVFWPDIVLVLAHKVVTPKAIHFFYEPPPEFLKLSAH